jgi:hypothetical protein
MNAELRRELDMLARTSADYRTHGVNTYDEASGGPTLEEIAAQDRARSKEEEQHLRKRLASIRQEAAARRAAAVARMLTDQQLEAEVERRRRVGDPRLAS